jgi:hypothetical protein
MDATSSISSTFPQSFHFNFLPALS